MEPIKIAVTDEHAASSQQNDIAQTEESVFNPDDQHIADQPVLEKEQKKPEKPTPIVRLGGLFLYKYITTLVSGLALLGLVTWSGATLIDFWLGDAARPNMFSEFVYRYQLYLVVSLVLFAGLHIVEFWLTTRASEEDQTAAAARIFRAIFLTILVLTVVGGLVTLGYVGADIALGTANYSAKQLLMIILDALLVTTLAGLLWWFFKQSRPRAATAYIAVVTLVTVVVTALLLAFPILKQRDAVVDARTSSDLSAISVQIEKFAQKNNVLPAGLHNLELDDSVKGRLGQYSYEVSQQKKTSTPQTDDLSRLYRGVSLPESTTLSYKLCATFKTDTTKDTKDDSVISLFGSSSSWTRHPSGRHCFDQTVYGGSSGSPQLTQPEESADFLKDIESL